MAVGEENSLSQRPLGEFCSGQGDHGEVPTWSCYHVWAGEPGAGDYSVTSATAPLPRSGVGNILGGV